MTSDETEGPDDADLPGLDDLPAEATGSDGGPDEWSHAELDDWFENDFGGHDAFFDFYYRGGGHRLSEVTHPDLHFGVNAYHRLFDNDTVFLDAIATDDAPWRLLGLEAKTRFRRGWENSRATAESVVGELAPYDALETLVDARHDLDASRSAVPRWVMIGGGLGVLGLVLAVGFFLLDGGGDEQEASTPATVGSLAVTAPPSTEVASTEETLAPAATPDTTVASTAASTVDTQPSAVAVDNPEQPVVPFPTRWSYTATKTADVVAAPEFITATPIGTELPWAFDVFETCGEVCTYSTVIYPLIPEALLGEVPETTWVVDGAEWSLDVTYQTVQSRNADGTVCVIRNRDVFELTVTDSVVDGRSVPATFTGSWIQANSLDLDASTGNPELYCGEAWEVVDEWSIEGVAAS